MKKIIALLLAMLMVFALVSCGSDKDAGASAPAESNSAASNETAKPEEKPTEDAAPVEDGTAADNNTVEAAKSFNVGVCQLVQHPALDDATQGFMDKLTELMKANGYEVTFDNQNAAGDSATCATICNQFVTSEYDLIMANATPALQAAVSATESKPIPVLGTSITDYATALAIADWTGATGFNVSGTADLAPLDQQANIIKELFPEAKTVGILYCSAEPNSKYQANVIKGYLQDMNFECVEFTFADSNDVAQVTQTACGECDVLYIPTDNTAASCTGAINEVAEKANKPIVAGEEGICKGCGVATLSISYYDLGTVTGEMAYEILVNGADVSTMQVQYAPQVTYEFVASRATALGITVPDTYVAIEAE